MKKNRIVALVLAMVILFHGLYIPAYATQESTGGAEEEQIPEISSPDDLTVISGCHTIDGAFPLFGSEERLTDVGAAILYELNSDTLLYAYNCDEAMYPSSLVKIMTALIAIENGNLEDVVTVRQSVIDSVPMGALKAGLENGEELTLRQLLYCMMVGSANDAAAVIAEHISGSQLSFVDLMNTRAAELGCEGTHFVNVTGLHDEQQVTTARDMAVILVEALKSQEFTEVFNTATYTLEATNESEAREFTTTNYFMTSGQGGRFTDSRVTGGRTGVTDSGERCLITTAQDEESLYITVVLGAVPVIEEDGYTITRHGSFENTQTLLTMAFEQQEKAQLLYQGQVMEQYPVINGTNDVAIGPAETFTCQLPVGFSHDDLTLRIEVVSSALTAPVALGQTVAVAQAWYGEICLAEVELVALHDVDANPLPTEADPEDNDILGIDAGAITTALAVLGGIFACILLIFGGLFIMRVVRGAMRKAKIRSRRQDRKRNR